MATVACVGALFCGVSTASAARGPVWAPSGASGGLRVLDSLRLSFPVPSSFGPYTTVSGTAVDGGFIKMVDVGARQCRIVLRVQGRVQRSRPSTASLVRDDFVAQASGLTGGRHWWLGRKSGDWLAHSWRTATSSTKRYGPYIAVTAFLTTDPSDGTTCDQAIAAEKAAAQKVAQSWVVVRAN